MDWARPRQERPVEQPASAVVSAADALVAESEVARNGGRNTASSAGTHISINSIFR